MQSAGDDLRRDEFEVGRSSFWCGVWWSVVGTVGQGDTTELRDANLRTLPHLLAIDVGTRGIVLEEVDHNTTHGEVEKH